jgi:hypothetical protein
MKEFGLKNKMMNIVIKTIVSDLHKMRDISVLISLYEINIIKFMIL